MIHLEHICYRTQERVIFEAFNLDVKAKERLVVLGPSGVGKSTLLRLIAGFTKAQKGKIILDGKRASIDDTIIIPPAKRSIGMLFQERALWPHFNVFENIDFGLKLKKIPFDKRQETIAHILHSVGLEGYEKRDISTLSGGEQQRVALARALVLEPKIMLMDEPLSSLENPRRQSLVHTILELQEAIGFTLLYVTHSTHEAQAIATKVLELS